MSKTQDTELSLKETSLRKCNLVMKGKEVKKLFCKTHRQYLMYVYSKNGQIAYRCQVGEDLHLPTQSDYEEVGV